ncbi:MAG: sulfate adenylyltransferase [Ruminococcus flavefaciens]|nr:sulfate adenylyltransferase [Ruminococcus flavefaciens]
MQVRRTRMSIQISINEETLQDLINIETGLLFPLRGFMGEADFRSVVENNRLADGQVFTIPVTLDVPEETYNTIAERENIYLAYGNENVARMEISSKFQMTKADILQVFGTLEDAHPGVYKEKTRSSYRIGGKTQILKKELLQDALRPADTKQIFKEKGWKTIVGFQTRNPVHKAHEYIQRLGLEVCDGLFINPIVGWKKRGDFTQEAVIAAYEAMIKEFYPTGRTYIAGLKTQMRYAGPREAIFHAIIRRNLGCTHFIIGRDHAGVGNYYGAYDAHELARKLSADHDLGIELLLTREPYYCTKCKQIVTENTCSHYQSHRIEISGTIIRRYISAGNIPDEIMMRKEIFNAILACKQIFIE